MKTNKQVTLALERLGQEIKLLYKVARPNFDYLDSMDQGAGESGKVFEAQITRLLCAFEDLKRRIDEAKQ